MICNKTDCKYYVEDNCKNLKIDGFDYLFTKDGKEIITFLCGNYEPKMNDNRGKVK